MLHSKTVLNEEVAAAAFLGHMRQEGGHHIVLGQVRKATAGGVLVHLMGTLGWVVGIQVAGVEVACARLGHHEMLKYLLKARRRLGP